MDRIPTSTSTLGAPNAINDYSSSKKATRAKLQQTGEDTLARGGGSKRLLRLRERRKQKKWLPSRRLRRMQDSTVKPELSKRGFDYHMFQTARQSLRLLHQCNLMEAHLHLYFRNRLQGLRMV